MSDIKTFQFDVDHIDKIREYHFGRNWPVVYILENKREAYVGETVDASYRCKQHLENKNRKRLERMHVIADDEYNKSATLDIESQLIQYMAAEGSFALQNGNAGQRDHNYFDKEKYRAKFEIIWEELKGIGIVKRNLSEIRNTNLFKYSPFKALTPEQVQVVNEIIKILRKKKPVTIVVSGRPGTGKTILATYLMKRLRNEAWSEGFKAALVVPMTSLRKTLKSVFSFVKDLNRGMVVGPSDVVGEKYDLLIVDEAHRLRQRKNITNYRGHDEQNKLLGLGESGTELDWIMMSAKFRILFYDKNQSVRPSDVKAIDFEALDAVRLDLQTQMRVGGGDEYISYVNNLFDNTATKFSALNAYDFRLFNDLGEMVREIQKKEREGKLSRVVAGYAWKWVSRDDATLFDINLDGVKLRWNSVNEDWVNSPNSINEVGCIHTVQGYDLNYAGVIIGPEITYDNVLNKFKVVRQKYLDRNGHAGVEHDDDLEGYILNIYKTLFTRGIRGTFIYAVDPALREYISRTLY